MALALALGRRGLGQTAPNPAVGAVLVRNDDNVVVGRGWTQPSGRPHAETEAIRRAGSAARGATLYVTLEPCSHHGKTPPCADAIIASGISRVVSAIEDPNPEVAGKGHAMLSAAGISVVVGVGAEEATRAHAGHISRMRLGRPHVTLKLAISADEKVALVGRRPVAITGVAARDRVHLMRAENDAQLVQSININLCRPEGHRRTRCGIGHPGWELAGYAGTNLHVQNLLAASPRCLCETQPLAMQRMPTIVDDNIPRSVC